MNSSVGDLFDESATDFQTQQLSAVEHLSIVSVSPAKQPTGLVSFRNPVIRDILWTHSPPAVIDFLIKGKIMIVGFLEKAALMLGLAFGAVILDGKHTVQRWAGI